MEQTKIDILATQLGQLLLGRGWIITTAESCTGGGIAQAITAIAGSSHWFEQGFVTYSNQAKHQQLGVSQELLVDQGAVSRPVVLAMAQGALLKSGANIAVAVSGIAGPGGGTEEKPVGTVWIAWAMLQQEQQFSQCYQFSGLRHSIRQQAIIEALSGVNKLLKKNAV